MGERIRPWHLHPLEHGIFPPVVQNFAEGAECGRASRKRGNFRLRFEVRPDREERQTAFPENIHEI